jgi:hypothetical protein
LLFVSSIFAIDAHATVLRVVTIQTDKVDAYLQELGRGQAWLKDLAKLRKVLSDSLYDELKP